MQKKTLVIIAVTLVAAAVVAALALLMTQPAAPPAPPVSQQPVPTPAEPPRDASHDDLIRVTYPQPGDEVASPLVVTGEARGNWYFEATFPVKLLDANGNEVVAFHAQAQGDWMTTEFVPFTATLEFEHPPATPTGTLVLMKDNPSGDPARDDSISIPVRFAPARPGQAWRACRKTGCGGQLCAEQDVVSDCLFKPEYACYKDAECARQADGACGWTQTPALAACLAHPPAP
ncbi:MAG TPA: Gmad2 immunoglobulin-like domain-containing protein [Candidatus Binatia bacterium]|nr:Gmad2 immunoglobulin-like domain-containing protein [Candidatus Binatia bacterium]